ncbi:methylamine utilization protein MauJ [Billgrantia ethanolica]|uniref:Uncharacterized protein n=1 Tax=Billgrantia ethanolica TaxID=2733486 RepID=A0ABS9A233_9GAMM|nr:methylamine utilization protein MauJ [Halomonas ethanolica]MCE8002825.1 hypothetical protein [Halomonas ethanolica]
MGLKVGEDLILFRLPLGGVEVLEGLVFCYGLESYGVIAPNLGSLRPQLTRQAIYSFKELPKAIYLFVSESRIKRLGRESIGAFLLQQADAYVFKWNKDNVESRLRARGSMPNYQEERADHYVNSDGGCSWVHDSLYRRALEAERPHAQALGFYQVLEYEARRHGLGRGSDLAALKNLLMDVKSLPHELLHQAYCTAFPEGDDVYGLKSLKGKIDRGKLGEVIYEVLRNPVVHAGGYGRKDEMGIPPYSLEQFAPSFKQTVCLTRELARHFVAQSGNCAG